jgi:TatD family-associated radical SAM protein
MNLPAIVYRFQDGVYINLTNRCPNLCAFCIKTKWKMDFHGNNLNLSAGEPSAAEVLAALEKELPKAPFKEVVFCGYGEPTMRLDVLLFVAQTLRGWRAQAKYPPFKIRLNTNGLGNLINHKDIVPALASVLDVVNVSLNAQDETTWRKLVRPAEGYEDGYESVVDFIRACASAGFEKVVASCVDNTGADPKAVQQVARSCGAQFYLRSFLDAQD